MDGVRTSYSLTMRSVSALAPAALISWPWTLGSSVWWPSMRFSHSGASSSSAWRWRSSGMYPTPASRISRVSHVGDVGVAEEDLARGGLAHPHDDLDELGLAVALDARDAEDLAGMDGEGDAVEDRAAREALEREVLHPQDDAVGDRRLLRAGRGQLRADHELGELAGVDALGVHRVDGGSAPDHGDAVGDAEHLVELVRDEQDRQALLLELAQVVEELVDLLRHQHRRGLVEDEGLGTAVEHLEDLDPLAVAHAEVLDELVGVDVEAVVVGDAVDLGAGLVADAVQLLGAQDDVLEDGEVVGQHEVLEHHADPGLDGVRGRVQAHHLAVDRDGALVGTLDAVEDLHQGRLAGAVLAHDRVDGATADGEGDVLVGDDAREAFRDALELNGEVGSGRWGGLRCGGSDGAHSWCWPAALRAVDLVR